LGENRVESVDLRKKLTIEFVYSAPKSMMLASRVSTVLKRFAVSEAGLLEKFGFS
jgi:hypothetical protein